MNIPELVNDCKTKGYGIVIGEHSVIDRKHPIMFACPVCGERYATREEAEECRDQPFDDSGMKVGDIVAVPGAWHSHGDCMDHWVAFTIPADPNSPDHFDRVPQHIPYFVVTCVHAQDRDPHRCLVTLASLRGGDLTVGWNPANGHGHYAMFRTDSDKHCDLGSTWKEMIQEYLPGCMPWQKLKEEAAELADLGIRSTNLL